MKITRRQLTGLIVEAIYSDGKEPPDVYRANRMLDTQKYRGTEYRGIRDPYDYVKYDKEGDEILSAHGEELLRFKATLDNIDYFRHNKSKVITDERFMTGLANDVIAAIENLPNIPGVPDVERQALGHYLAVVYTEIPPQFITAGASARTTGEVPFQYRSENEDI